MKRITLLVVLVAALAAAAFVMYPDEFLHYSAEAIKAAGWLWEQIKANPVPASLAAASFLLTVLYHKARGKSLRESVEVAATRVTVVPVPIDTGENAVVRRAKARATRTQLLADQIGLENRQRKLPEEIVKAEKDACYSEQAVAKLDSLRQQRAECDAELAEIQAELEKLAELV